MWILVHHKDGTPRLVNFNCIEDVVASKETGCVLTFAGRDDITITIRESLADLAALVNAKQAPIRPEVSGD